jgi:hypothetical protein
LPLLRHVVFHLCGPLLSMLWHAQERWLDLLYYPEHWFDNRPQPADSRRPDFKHKESNAALWLDDANAKHVAATCARQYCDATRLTRALLLLRRYKKNPTFVPTYMGMRGEPKRPWEVPTAGDDADEPAQPASADPEGDVPF